ncbi:MAG: ABC transporter substrate-binding protein [Bacteroidetes bacterium]|nr:ABC transporter substrate-binding protein [Bacteroidota bacterium]
MNRAFRFFLLVAVAATFFLGGCGQSKGVEGNGLKIFRYNEPSGIATLDPAFAKDLPHTWVCNQLFNGLVSLDDEMHIVPAIAKKWEVSADGLTYTFTLRSDVYFHEDVVFGSVPRKVAAKDFVFSFKRLLSPELASPGTWIFNQVARSEDGYAFDAPNDSTFSIELIAPFPPFLGMLSMPYAAVLPEEAVAYYGTGFRNHPVGTGPFQFTYWKEGVKLVLRKNKHYFEASEEEDCPKIDAVAISFLIDKQTAFMEFAKGELDFMSGIDARYKDEVLSRDGELKRKYTDRINLIRRPFLNTEYLGLLIREASGNSVADKKLRQAINYGIDRRKLIRYLRNGIGIAGHHGMIPPGLPGYNAESTYGYTYNPVLAKELLTESGKRNVPITLTTTADYVDICKFVQSQLGELGMQVNIEVSPAAMMREMRAKGKLEFFRASWVADYPDAENYLSLFYGRNKAPAGPNYTRFQRQAFDALYDKAMQTTDPAERLQYYTQLDSLVMDEAAVVVLFYDESLRFVNKRVAHFNGNPINLLDLRKVELGDS